MLFGVQRIEIAKSGGGKIERGREVERGQRPACRTMTCSRCRARRARQDARATFDWNQIISGAGKFEAVNLAPFFNDKVTQIFRNEYRSPRSPFASLATPKQGIGGWCEPTRQLRRGRFRPARARCEKRRQNQFAGRHSAGDAGRKPARRTSFSRRNGTIIRAKFPCRWPENRRTPFC